MLLEAFIQRASQAGATVIVAAQGDVGQNPANPNDETFISRRAAAALGQDPAIGNEKAAAHDTMSATIGAELAIAETGSLLIVHDDHLETNAFALARHLKVVIEQSRIVESLTQAVPVLEKLANQNKNWTLLSGPSRTADIERILTIGVHGSFDLEILVLHNQQEANP